jgi:hypothetical protein
MRKKKANRKHRVAGEDGHGWGRGKREAAVPQSVRLKAQAWTGFTFSERARGLNNNLIKIKFYLFISLVPGGSHVFHLALYTPPPLHPFALPTARLSLSVLPPLPWTTSLTSLSPSIPSLASVRQIQMTRSILPTSFAPSLPLPFTISPPVPPNYRRLSRSKQILPLSLGHCMMHIQRTTPRCRPHPHRPHPLRPLLSKRIVPPGLSAPA